MKSICGFKIPALAFFRQHIGSSPSKVAGDVKSTDERRLRHQEGSALVEMALTIPILLTVFTGAASFSMGFYKMQQLGYATAAATQQVSSMAGETTDPCAQIVTSVTASLPGWSTGSLNYKAVITDSTGTTHTYPSTGMSGNTFSCTAGATLMGANEPIVVSVSYAYTWFPILQFTQSGNLYSTEAALME